MQDTSIMKYPISAAPTNTPVTILRTGGEYHIKGIEGNQRDFETENLDQTTRYNEFIITTIRTVWGTPIEKLKQEFGNELWEYCRKMSAPYLENGKLEIHEGALRLTREGIFISDSIMSDLLWVN